MTNGNSAERERFEKWALEEEIAFECDGEFFFVEGPNAMYVAWDAWQAALSVCADRPEPATGLAHGGKGEAVCAACNGSGWVVRDPDIGTDQECFVCGGSGKDPQTECAPRADLTSNERYQSQMVAICAASGYTYTAGASERADAEKDAALNCLKVMRLDMLDWLNTDQRPQVSDVEQWVIDIDAAILAANKEPQP